MTLTLCLQKTQITANVFSSIPVDSVEILVLRVVRVICFLFTENNFVSDGIVTVSL